LGRRVAVIELGRTLDEGVVIDNRAFGELAAKLRNSFA